MAVEFVASGASPGADASQAVVIVKPIGLASGNLMVAKITIFIETAAIVTPPADWTLIRADMVDGVIKTWLFWKNADAADAAAADFTFTIDTACTNLGAMSARTGHDPISPINAHNGQGNASSATVTAPTITPAVANCMICMEASASNDLTCSGYAITDDNPASWLEAYDVLYNGDNDMMMAEGYALRPETSATGNGTATMSNNRTNVGQLIAIAPASEEEETPVPKVISGR